MRAFFGLCLAILVVTSPHHAWADARDPAAAEALFAQGRAAMKRGDYAIACAKFDESESLDPTAVGTLLNLAECEEQLGKVASAWQHLRRAREQLPPHDDRVEYATAHANVLEARLPKLTIRLAKAAPTGTRVRRGQIDVGEASFGAPLPADPGTYEVVASAPGFSARRFTAELRLGETTELEVDVGAPLDAAPPRTPDHAATSSWRTAGLALGGGGAVGLGLGTVMGILAIDRNNTVKSLCNASGGCVSGAGVVAGEQGRTYAAISTASFIAGAALVAGGIVLVLTHPRATRPPVLGASQYAGQLSGTLSAFVW